MKKIFLGMMALTLSCGLFAADYTGFVEGYYKTSADLNVGTYGLDVNTPLATDIKYNPATDNLLLLYAGGEGNADNPASILVVDRETGVTERAIAGVESPTCAWGFNPMRLGVTDDGVILSYSQEGYVKKVGPESTADATSATMIIDGGAYGYWGGGAGFYVTGNYNDGTCKIVASRASTLSFFENSAGAIDTFTKYGGTIDTGSGRVCGIAATDDLSTVYTYAAGNGGSRKWEGSPSAGYTEGTGVSTYAWESYMTADLDGGMILHAGGHDDLIAHQDYPAGYTYFRFGAVDIATDQGIGAGNSNDDFGANECDPVDSTFPGLYVKANILAATYNGAVCAVNSEKEVYSFTRGGLVQYKDPAPVEGWELY